MKTWRMLRALLWSAPALALMAGALCWPGSQSTAQTTDVVLIGAGDIADGFSFNLSNAFATAALLDAYPTATVFANGDLAYENGSDGDFAKTYNATWGRAKARTIPVVGNHEYDTLFAAGYYSYWGPTAGNFGCGCSRLKLRHWHIVVL